MIGLAPKSRCNLELRNGAKFYFVQLFNCSIVQLEPDRIIAKKISFCLSFLAKPHQSAPLLRGTLRSSKKKFNWEQNFILFNCLTKMYIGFSE